MSTSSKTRARRACGTVDHTLCKAHECRELKCHKTLQKVKWSREEDERLKRLVAQHEGADWDLIADNFKRRTDIQCQQRWQKVLNPELVKGPWTKEEDQRVTELVQKYGPKSWSVIAKHLHGRIGKQCRERWHNHLNPEVKKSSWTHDEDLVIYEAHKRLGNRWAEISKLLPGRTDNSIKNHWNSTMRRKVEHEGYLQEVPPPRTCKGKAPIKRKTKPISPMGLLHGSHNHYLMTLPTKISGYPLVLLDGPYADSVPETSVFVPHTEGCCSWSSSLTEEGLSLVNSTLSCLGDQSMEVHPGASVYTADSPSKYLEVEASAVLSSLQTIPEFAETLELIDSDPVAWSEVASFSLKKVTSPLEQEAMPLPGDMQEVPSYHLDDSDPISDLNRSYMELMSASSPSVTRLSTPHSILKRGETGERGEQSPFSEGHSSTSFLDNSDSSPRLTPVKALPFSPSQFFNVCGGEDLNLDDPALTSTPVCGHKRACTTTTPLHKDLTPKYHKDNAGFQTPKVRKAIMLPTPQTPTPFKTTTATQEKMHGPMKLMPQSLGYLEEDFKEVLREESGVEVLMHGDSDNDFCSWTQEMDTPSKRVRKFLTLEPWSKDCLSTQLCSQEHFNNVQVSVEWEAVVFGKTDDQLSMTEQARRYLPSHTGAPPCLPRGLVL